MSTIPQMEFIDQQLRLHVPHAVATIFDDHVGRNSMDYQRLFFVPSSSQATKARVTAEDDQSSFAMKPGTICMLAADRPYRFDFPDGFHLGAFHFRLEYAGVHEIFQDVIPFKVLSTQAVEVCDQAFELLHLRSPRDWLRAEALLRQYVAEAFTCSWREIQERAAGLRKWELVLNELATAPYSSGLIELLAQRLDISRHHLTRSFRKEFHCTPRDWHRRQLSKRIVTALLNDDRPLADLADDFGFSDGFALSRFVSHSTGKSPAIIRKHGFFGF